MNFCKILLFSFSLSCAFIAAASSSKPQIPVASIRSKTPAAKTPTKADSITIPDVLTVCDTLHYPAEELYNFTWTSERLNPYRILIDSMPDSLRVDCSNFVFPTKSNHVTSTFGFRRYRYHYGVDLGLTVGDTIRAAFDGKIRIVDYEAKGYGHFVLIRHNNGLESVSAHMSRVLVKENQNVKAGDPIGLGGSTGHSTGPHLHFELRMLGNAFNPAKLIDIENKCVRNELYIVSHTNTYSHNRELKQLAARKIQTTAQARMARYYRVRSGDTLSHIARHYGTSVSRLCALNHIRSTSVLRVGQRIRYK